ncbi:hypothetical protein ES703_107652 [subsurface metagenome]
MFAVEAIVRRSTLSWTFPPTSLVTITLLPPPLMYPSTGPSMRTVDAPKRKSPPILAVLATLTVVPPASKSPSILPLTLIFVPASRAPRVIVPFTVTVCPPIETLPLTIPLMVIVVPTAKMSPFTVPSMMISVAAT